MTPTTNGAVLPGCGLPAWAVCQLDALLSAGLLHHSALVGLDGDRLCELAREAVRASLAEFDAESVLAAIAGKVAA